MDKIKMKALTYQGIPQGNDKQYAPKDGEFYVFNEQEAVAREERGLAERISKETTSETEPSSATEKPSDDGAWKLQISPEAYLDKWPEGPNAEQAREILKKRSAEESGSGTKNDLAQG